MGKDNVLNDLANEYFLNEFITALSLERDKMIDHPDSPTFLAKILHEYETLESGMIERTGSGEDGTRFANFALMVAFCRVVDNRLSNLEEKVRDIHYWMESKQGAAE